MHQVSLDVNRYVGSAARGAQAGNTMSLISINYPTSF